MQEFIGSQQAETLILAVAVAVAIAAGAGGYFAVGPRGVLMALYGPLLWLLWQGHKWITRYDAQTEYFGLDKVWVLAVEVVVFVALGIALGWMWNKIQNRSTAKSAKDAKDILG